MLHPASMGWPSHAFCFGKKKCLPWHDLWAENITPDLQRNALLHILWTYQVVCLLLSHRHCTSMSHLTVVGNENLFSKGIVNSWSLHSDCLLFSIFPGLEVAILEYLLWKDYQWYLSLCCLFGWFWFFLIILFNLHRLLYVPSAPIGLNFPDQSSLEPPPLPWASRSLLSSNWDLHPWSELEQHSRAVTAEIGPLSVKVRQQIWVGVGVGNLNSPNSPSGLGLWA